MGHGRAKIIFRPISSIGPMARRYAVNIGAGIPFWLGLRLIQAVPGRDRR